MDGMATPPSPALWSSRHSHCRRAGAALAVLYRFESNQVLHWLNVLLDAIPKYVVDAMNINQYIESLPRDDCVQMYCG